MRRSPIATFTSRPASEFLQIAQTLEHFEIQRAFIHSRFSRNISDRIVHRILSSLMSMKHGIVFFPLTLT